MPTHRDTRGKNLEYAYLAGLADGEGYIGLQFSKNSKGQRSDLRPQFVITNSDWPTIERLQQTYGGYVHEKSRKSGWKRSWNWRVTCDSAVKLLVKLLPHLRIKKRQALLAIHVQRHKTRHVKTYQGYIDQTEVDRRQRWFDQMAQYNRRGSPAETK